MGACNQWNNEFNPFQKFKVLCWFNRMEQIPSGNFAPPVNVAFDLCQGTRDKKLCAGVRCNFCMSDLEDRGEEARVPPEVLMQIPAFYRQWGVKSVCLAGHHSDPFVYNHEHLSQFLRLMYRNDVEVGINTNGVVMTEFLKQEVTRNCKWTGFSVNAGTAKTHALITNTKDAVFDVFDRIVQNIAEMNEYCRRFKIRHPTCFKFLITDDNYGEILDAIRLAREIGCRQIQIRPTELPECRSSKIDVTVVEQQIAEGLAKWEIPHSFEIFGIREKFTADLKKKRPRRCIATPLGSTWKADGDIVICPDRRWSAHQDKMVLGNYINEGLEAIRRKWGGPQHREMIEEANRRLGECIRCTAYQWHELYENTVADDVMDLRLI